MSKIQTKLIIGFVLAILFCSCSTIYHPKDDTLKNLSVEQARKDLSLELKQNESRAQVKFTNSYYNIVAVNAGINKLDLTGDSGDKETFFYHELPDVSLVENAGKMYDTVKLDEREAFLIKYPGSHTVMNALYVLKNNSIKQKKEMAESEERFSFNLSENLKKAKRKDPLPEDALKNKYLAETAVKNKSFLKASDYFGKALRSAPWWGAGYFNRALILSEIGDYEMAAHEMRHYLQITPDAPNARPAQNKIYEWEAIVSGKD